MRAGTCQCGGALFDSSHEVKTEEGAFSWGVVLCVLPLKVFQRECHSCGRYGWRAFDQTGARIAGRGW